MKKQTNKKEYKEIRFRYFLRCFVGSSVSDYLSRTQFPP